jgi:murein DD-endopeptidase MepM/ murein hydrolase activator NlpD
MVNYSSENMDLRSTPSCPRPQRRTLAWVRILALLGGVGVSGGNGFAWAQESEAVHLDDLLKAAEAYQTSADYLKPNSATTHAPRPSADVSLNPGNAPAPVPAFSRSNSSLHSNQTLSPSSEASAMQPPVPAPPAAAIVAEAPAAAESMVESLQRANNSTQDTRGKISVPTAEAVANDAATPSGTSGFEANPPGQGAGFIDPTDYSVGATQAPTVVQPNLVFAERSTGCQLSVPSGETNPVSSCATAATSTVNAATPNPGIQVGPVNVSSRGVKLGSTTVISREFLNEKLRPLNVLRRGNEEYVFPLSIPAPITSLFGWRMHPIHQSWRFHSGTDLAAPEGTPVLATRAGRVAVSDNLGGYGLTVILRHDEDNLESRYAHLSRIAVRPGEWVEQGEVIGLVGNTGTSTGPHLHFEMRQLTAQGWVAVDAQEVLEDGIANLLQLINNPLMALGQADNPNAEGQAQPTNYPFRPAQPNAS